MRRCSVCRGLQIVVGDLDDYHRLAHYHYRSRRLGPYAAIFALRPTEALAARAGTEPVGVIVYRMPSPYLELRNVATGNWFIVLDRTTALSLVNKNIRCISRVIIEPRFRNLSLASRLVRETMARVDVPIVEAMAVMGLVNPFFEKAGMKAYTSALPARCVRLGEAFSMVGLERRQLIDSQKVQQALERLGRKEAEFIDSEMRCFLQSYGKRRYMPAGAERTEFILSRLTDRPVYYIWLNENLELRI